MNNEKVVAPQVFKGIRGGEYEVYNKEIGDGDYGYVVKGVDRNTGLTYAVKVFHTDENSSIAEIRAYTRLKDSPFVVNLIDYHKPGQKEFLVLEKMDEELVFFSTKSVKELYDLIEQILEGMIDIHEHGLSHGDAHESNIMFSRSKDGFKVKYVDFGRSRMSKTSISDDVKMMIEELIPSIIKNIKDEFEEEIATSDAVKELYSLFFDPKETLEENLEELRKLRKKHS